MNLFRNLFIEKKERKSRIASLTAYDYPMGKMLDATGLDFILVGDSLGMVVLGYPDTTQVTLEMMIHHTAAVARGVKTTPVFADLPAHSTDTPSQAVASARRLMEVGAQGVKMEGGRDVLTKVKAILDAGIPVMGHIGMLPQRVREEGGYHIKGKTPAEAEGLIEDAVALADAGVFAMVLELVSPPLAEAISQKIPVPTVGIGSGQGCDGQILVTPDLLGLFPWFTPRFVRPKLALASQIDAAVKEYIAEIRAAG